MARFAPVAPVQVLRGLYDYSPRTFGDYHLLLAHHTVDKSQEFTELFRKIYSDHDEATRQPTIIMDNSLVELKTAVDLPMVEDAVRIVQEGHPSAGVYAVLPDVMGDGPATISATEAAHEEWASKLPCGLMAVAQGATLDLFESTLLRLLHLDIDIIGIPRILVAQHGSRQPAIKLAREILPAGIRLHLLGFSDNMVDDLQSTALLNPYEGIDSAVPLRINAKFDPGMVPEQRDPTWFDTAEVNPQMIENLQIVRSAIGDN